MIRVLLTRVSLSILLILVCFTAGIAYAADTVPASSDPLQYLLNLGPIGALVWGAYKLGSGVKLSVVVELSDRDRALFNSRAPSA